MAEYIGTVILFSFVPVLTAFILMIIVAIFVILSVVQYNYLYT